jgi:hypothetical protein
MSHQPVRETARARRDFLQASALAVGAWGTTAAVGAADSRAATDSVATREHYEWRTYRAAQSAQQDRVLEYLQGAALPAWKRLSIGPIGVFTEIGEAATPSVHVLLTFPSPTAALTVRAEMEADSGYAAAAAEYLSAPPGDPAFTRIDSTLLVAFAGQPRLAVPRRAPRVFEVRTYESYSEAKARRKIEMFNSGEIPIFREAGFETVFFGESLVGPSLPNLKYLLAAPDMQANQAGWKNFIGHPDWVAMKDLPQYADTVSHIDKVYLAPTSFSEV